MQKIDSKISFVTVFPRLAQIQRSGTVKLSPGLHKLAFTDLPAQLNRDSVQVEGDDRLLLHDIRVEQQQLETTAHPHLEKLQQMEKDLIKKQALLLSRQGRLDKEQSFVDGLGQRVTTATDHSVEAEWSPDNWKQLLTFFGGQLERIDEQKFRLNEEIQNLALELDRIKREIRKLGHSPKNNWQVVVQVECETEIEANLELRYVVSNARWEPLYDLRVDSEAQQISLMYKAKVFQNTGEDWTNIGLKLSTAQPALGANPPENRQHLVGPMPKPKPVPEMYASAAPAEVMLEDSMPRGRAMVKKSAAPQRKMKRKEVAVSENILSANFELQGEHTVRSDNQANQFHVRELALGTEFQYLTVPRFQEAAFLQAEITNDSGLPLLPGKASIFLDGQFVSNTDLPAIAPGEEFQQSLGIDPGVKVKHELLKKFRKSQGLMSKKDRHIYQYEIKLNNHKKRAIKIEVQDRYPLSTDEQIKTELIKPAYKADTESLKVDAQHLITWTLHLNAAEEKVIELEYAVHYPEGMKVVGL